MADEVTMQPIADVVEQVKSAGLGYERIEHIAGSTYQDTSTIVIIPTRGMMHHKMVNAFIQMITPMNQKRAVFFCSGEEVGKAYNRMITQILADPEMSKWKYIMTIEDDNLIPPDAHVRLLESIEGGKFDAVSGIYFTKGEVNLPMAYGDPERYLLDGVIDFRPRDIREGLKNGYVMPVLGIAQGCALYRMDLFRQIEGPWFVTCADYIPEKGVQMMTQDLYFCNNAIKQGKRFAVDLRVKVGHMDVNTGLVY